MSEKNKVRQVIEGWIDSIDRQIEGGVDEWAKERLGIEREAYLSVLGAMGAHGTKQEKERDAVVHPFDFEYQMFRKYKEALDNAVSKMTKTIRDAGVPERVADMAKNLEETARNILEGKGDSSEAPIYEILKPNESLIISRNEEGILVACNRNGEVEIKRILYPSSDNMKEEEEKKRDGGTTESDAGKEWKASWEGTT
jgi:hypothetical protein